MFVGRQTMRKVNIKSQNRQGHFLPENWKIGTSFFFFFTALQMLQKYIPPLIFVSQEILTLVNAPTTPKSISAFLKYVYLLIIIGCSHSIKKEIVGLFLSPKCQRPQTPSTKNGLSSTHSFFVCLLLLLLFLPILLDQRDKKGFQSLGRPPQIHSILVKSQENHFFISI